MFNFNEFALTSATIEGAYSYRSRIVNQFLTFERYDEETIIMEEYFAAKVSTIYSSISNGKSMDNHTTIKIKVDETIVYIGFEGQEVWIGFSIRKGDSANCAEKL